MNRKVAIIVSALGIALGVLGLTLFLTDAVDDRGRAKDVCEARGGYYVALHANEDICIDKSIVINMEEQ